MSTHLRREQDLSHLSRNDYSSALLAATVVWGAIYSFFTGVEKEKMHAKKAKRHTDCNPFGNAEELGLLCSP